jgi:transposase
MDAAPPLPSEVLASLPPAVAALIAWQSEQIRLLTARVAEREGQLNQNSSHSSKPPSADPPSAKPVPARTPSGKKRGGPPGHPKHERTILPPDEIRDHKPSPGGGCRRPLTGDDPQPLIEQVVDPPEKRRPVIHHRRHTLTGPHGRATTAAVASPETRTGFGPKLQAVTAYLSGVGRMGKRPIRPFGDDVLGIPIRRGSVSHRAASTARALAPIPAEARSAIEGRDANVEETGWKHGRKKAWRWVAVTPLLSVFRIHRHRSRAAFESLMGPSLGVRTADRFSEARSCSGLETTPGWCRKTVRRAGPCRRGRYPVVAVRFEPLPESKRTGAVSWPVTFSDAWCAVRRRWGAEALLPPAGDGSARQKRPPPVRELLLVTLAPAA